MSFGFSLGDFIAVIELANKIRREFVGAPFQFKNISDEVRSLSIVIQDVDVLLSECETDAQQKADLEEIARGCHNILTDLEMTLDKYGELQADGGNLSKKVKRAWKRLKWEPEDIRELRDRITSNIILLNTFVTRISSQATLATKKGMERLNEQQDSQERLTILDWLTPIDYAPQQSDFINRRQEGTGQWLLDSPEFQAWLRAEKQTLFCPGIPGAGKTILTSIVIDELTTLFENEKSIGIAYLYCNFRSKDYQTVEDLLASLLNQLAQGWPTLPDSVRSLYDKYRKKRTRPPCYEISQTLLSVAALYSRVFIIVDALDECRATGGCRAQFLSEIFDLQAKCTVNVFATSRHIAEIVEKFDDSVLLEIRATEQDVRRYIDGHMSQLPSFVGRSPDLQEYIRTEIVKAVDGMFLLAQLHLDSLVGKRSPKSIRAALTKLPTGSEAYDYTYKDAMERIEGQVSDQEELAKQILSWITHAKRPLTTLELQHAVAVEVNSSELDRDNIPEIEDMVSACAGLVTVDNESNIIRLVHYTTQEYFERTRKDWFPNAEIDITKICIAYVTFEVFESGFCRTDNEFEERLRSHPLYDYAAHYWGYHARMTSTLRKEAIAFLESKAKVEASSQALLAVKQYSFRQNYSQDIPRQVTALHLIAYFGVNEAVRAILRDLERVDLKDSYDRTPLSWAAENGREAVIKLLLDNGASINSMDKDNETPLSWASKGGHEAVVKLLLDRGADLSHNNGWRPLRWAIEYGNEAIVKLLLDGGADVNMTGGDWTLLNWALSRGEEAIARLLLVRGVDVNAKSRNGWTPLSLAASRGNDFIVKPLLDRGADVNAKGRNGWTPLSLAASRGNEAIVRLLLDRGVEINAKSADGSTSLRRAPPVGFETVREPFYVDIDSPVNSRDSWTPLSEAAWEGHEGIVRLLLDRGADANPETDDSWLPLRRAASKGHEGIVKVLLDRGADVNPKTDDSWTPLRWAASNGHEAIVELLLDRGADVNAKTDDGWTPLRFAASRGNGAMVKLLLDKGPDVNAKTDDGWTPLLGAAANGHDTVVKLLLDGGADVNAEDNNGCTPLSWAASRGHDTIVELLRRRS